MKSRTLSCRLVQAFWLFLVALLTGATVGALGSELPTLPVPAQTREQHTPQGPVRLTLTLDKQTMRLADRLHLHLSVEAPLQMRVQLPAVSDQLGPFRVHEQRTLEPQLITPQRRIWQQEYTLETDTVGTVTIPELGVSFQPEDAAFDTTAQSLRTDPYPVTVTAIVPADADVTTPKDIAPPVALPRRGWPPWVWYSMAACAGAGLVSALWWYRRRRRVPAAPATQPAHLVALEALRRLQRDDCIGQHRIEEFYVRLSAIVRHYIEWRFGLRAPEQTTEEFLAVVLHADQLIAAHQSLLSAFLEQCDLVKFARYQPTAQDMQHALASAHTFIEQTGDMQVVVAVSGVEV